MGVPQTQLYVYFLRRVGMPAGLVCLGRKLVGLNIAVLRRLPLLCLCLALAGCNALDDVTSGKTPWYGYAMQRDTGKFGWTLLQTETFRDCIETLAEKAQRGALHPLVASISPYGCAFHGNNYWQVWLYNGNRPGPGNQGH